MDCYILWGMSLKPSPVEVNRNGRLTASQRSMVLVGVLFTMGGLTCMGLMLLQLVLAVMAGVMPQNLVMWLFFILTLAAFLYLGLTLYVNARTFILDLFSRT
ncbi:MAG: hypothetical protein K8I82_00415, partial [Anaerolineae bacterium]|nr:hypothetical protein [Anaerolineae bacterium]